MVQPQIDTTALAAVLSAKSDELAGAAALFAVLTERVEPVDVASPDASASPEGGPAMTLTPIRTDMSTVDRAGSAVELVDLAQPTDRPRGVLAWLGGWLCPAGANCWRVARRAAVAGLALVPIELLIGAGAVQVRHVIDGAGIVHLSPAGVAVVTVASPLLFAVTAGVTRWWGHDRGWLTGEILTGAEADAVLAAYQAQRAASAEDLAGVRDVG